jgi:(p)ppGpp synthase/HD superfamily hydrolase
MGVGHVSKIETAIKIAVDAHGGQTDLSGQPYILHPLRVMLAMPADAERAAAVLHDVVEDTEVTLEDLRLAGLPEEVIAAVDCVTKRKGEAYTDYLDRIANNPIARRVKLADLQDNMRVDRLVTMTDRDLKRLEKYRHARERLLSQTECGGNS